jgi:hypothetical protein
VNYSGEGTYTTGDRAFSFPDEQPKDTFALDGAWTLSSQHITPTGDNGQVRLNYRAKEVRMVLSGNGTVTYKSGDRTRTITVTGTPNSYRLVSTKDIQAGNVTVTVDRGVQAFSFTFG